MPGEKPWETDGNEADDESDSEIDDTEAYDEDVDDEKNATKTEQARRELLSFLGDWLENQENVVWTTPPKAKDGIPGAENKEEKEENPELYNIYYNIDAILRQAISKDSPKIQFYKDTLTRLAPWVNKGKERPSQDYEDRGEIAALEHFIKNWELKAQEEYQDKKDDINNAIDNIKAYIRQHLVNWKDKLDLLVPKDLDTRKETAKDDLIAWETATIKKLKDWLTANKKKNTEGHEVELTKNEQKLLKGIIKQAEGAVKSKKIEIHHKLIGNIRVKLGQLVEETIPEPDEAIPDASHYKDLFNDINAGTNLFKAWSNLLTQIDKPSQESENAKKYIKYIDFSLIKDKLGVYNELVKRIKEIDAKEENIKPFEICITGGGTECENHPAGGNWLPAWKKALARLKKLEKDREREKEEKEKPACECLHCTHGLGAWTWINCPFYDFSIFKDKEKGKLGTIMGPDNAPHWIPPRGWTPFYRPDGKPNENKCNNRVNNRINKDVEWKWEPREEHGGDADKPKPKTNKGKEKQQPTSSRTSQQEPPAKEEIDEETIFI